MEPIVEYVFSDPVAIIKREYEELQQQARQELAAQGRRFMGPKRVMKASPYQRAKSWEDIRGLNPTFAVGREQHEARKRAVAALKTFRQAYRTALDLWRGGKRSVQLPKGTWWIVTFHGAAITDSG
jgi:hypothetical protein